MVKTTRLQREALFRIFQKDFPSWITPYKRSTLPAGERVTYWRAASTAVKVPSIQYRKFRKTVQPGPGCIMVQWKGMWLGIEPDGYTHS